jgi:adenylate cyclase
VASTRRLAAIMFTDMVGSTAAAQSDEERALQLRDENESLIRPLFAAHQGREVKSMGDGFLAEFDSALRAVQCAVAIQQHLHERNAQPGVPPIQLRIGIHLGDVEQRGTDIFGDAVNIASRIEPLASPGGICISGEVVSQVRNKIPNQLTKMPATPLKGVQGPMEVYQVVLPWTAPGRTLSSQGLTRLAVLPFANISPDPKDEYFADGLTEELISVLSQLRDLRVIARTSVMPYKSTSKGVAQIGSELGVDAVLEGSVRKSGDELRITIQLIDVGTEEHTWANSYDRKMEKVFAVQTEIAKQVADALKVGLRPADQARLDARPTVRPESYMAYLKGRTLLHSHSKEALLAAKAQFELAIALDERNAAAYSGMADTCRIGWMVSTDADSAKLDADARRFARRALELDPTLAEAHSSLGLIVWDDFEYTAAEREYQQALALNHSLAQAHHWYSLLLQDEGRADEALIELGLAEASDPMSPLILEEAATLLSWMGRFDEAKAKIARLGELSPDSFEYHLAGAWYYRAQGDSERLIKSLARMEELETESQLKPFYRALAYAWSGEKDRSRKVLREFETVVGFARTWWQIAFVYADLGDLDDCFRLLDKAVQARTIGFQAIRLDPRFEFVRSDPRFASLLKRMNLA